MKKKALQFAHYSVKEKKKNECSLFRIIYFRYSLSQIKQVLMEYGAAYTYVYTREDPRARNWFKRKGAVCV